jgi:cell wall-associated NlpC family hydrolase
LAALACAAIGLGLLGTPAALAGTGGTAPPHAKSSATVPGARARIVHGRAIAPASAPPAVQQVIAAANRISDRPYKWGGGHGAWASSGYDCSGSVSYALHGGGFLDSPMDSGGLRRWGVHGRGDWITVYTNRSHAYAVIAGLRWDTSGNRRGVSGPRWHRQTRAATRGRYRVRHAPGY